MEIHLEQAFDEAVAHVRERERAERNDVLVLTLQEECQQSMQEASHFREMEQEVGEQRDMWYERHEELTLQQIQQQPAPQVTPPSSFQQRLLSGIGFGSSLSVGPVGASTQQVQQTVPHATPSTVVHSIATPPRPYSLNQASSTPVPCPVSSNPLTPGVQRVLPPPGFGTGTERASNGTAATGGSTATFGSLFQSVYSGFGSGQSAQGLGQGMVGATE
eukprot:6464256-Amphidinium_carterae.1